MGVLFGMAMTEKQGGPTCGHHHRRARDRGALSGRADMYVLGGHKWFCSAPQSDAFLVLARAPEGLSCFLVPRVLPGGERNPFLVQRLKDKLGNKSNASSEVEFDGTVGWMVGEPGRGVRTIIEMVGRTRLDCVLGAAAGMRQGVAEAVWHARHRQAFGARLIDQPAMAAVIADLQLKAEAATWTALRLAAAHDDEDAAPFRRLATAVGKYWVCKRGPNHAYESLECPAATATRRASAGPPLPGAAGAGGVGGIGQRDRPDVPVPWPGNLSRWPRSTPSGHAAGHERPFDQHVERCGPSPVGRPPTPLPPRGSPPAGRAMALALQAATLLAHAPAPLRRRSAWPPRPDRSAEYGALPDGVDIDALVERA